MAARAAVAIALSGLLVLAGCAGPTRGTGPGAMAPADTPAAARCEAAPVALREPAPLFTGPGAGAALDQALPAGKAVVLCGVQGQRRQVLLPRPGQRCPSATACASGWIPRNAKTGPAN